MLKKANIVLLIMTLCTSVVCAQTIGRSVVSVLGQSVSENEFYLCQTAGESFACTIISGSQVLCQGFQQPSLINLRDPDGPSLFDAIDVYPNPVSRDAMNFLTVSFRINELSNYGIEIFNLMGKMVFKKNYEGMISQDIKIDFSGFEQSMYLIHVYSDNFRMNRFFKIEKL